MPQRLLTLNSISKKFLIPAIIFMVILLGGLGTIMINKNHATIQYLMESKGNALANNLARISANYVMNFDLQALELFVNEALRDPDVVFVVFYDAERKPLTESSKPPSDLSTLLIYNREILSLREDQTPVGYLQIGYSQETLAKNLHSGIETVVISNLVALILLILGVTILFRGITNPLAHLVGVIEKVAQGDLTARVSSRLVDRRDEMGVLAVSFNRMSEELARSHEHLEEQVKARTAELEAFIYTVSHDLKSPVVSMNGMASMMKDQYFEQLDETARHYLDRIIGNANYMEELIQGLLALSRIGRMQERRELIEVKEVIQNVLEILQNQLTKRNIAVSVHAPLPHFMFNPIQLAQIFQNLISNATKFMGDQSHPQIEIGGKESERGVEFYVKDNGIGIDPAYHDKIFAIFQRLQDVNVEGTGVGLPIVKKIVDLNDGKIWVESEKGKVATFYIWLPQNNKLQPAGQSRSPRLEARFSDKGLKGQSSEGPKSQIMKR
ncbi:MAG: HAMP domain-containing protein [Nitrospirae bacterium]|nr:HAMP domain-containing protein [Candidatus Manganitrophaceae bacterium]